jgi:predicted  nucleic acid-binding Zn-ribbon protein
MFSRHRWAKKMRNPNDEYDRLHDHMTAIARERDNSNEIIKYLKKRIEELEDELVLAHEALARRYTRP